MANDNSNDTVAVYCRVDKETDGLLISMADELNYPKSTVAGLVLRLGARMLKRQVLKAAQEANGSNND